MIETTINREKLKPGRYKGANDKPRTTRSAVNCAENMFQGPWYQNIVWYLVILVVCKIDQGILLRLRCYLNIIRICILFTNSHRLESYVCSGDVVKSLTENIVVCHVGSMIIRFQSSSSFSRRIPRKSWPIILNTRSYLFQFVIMFMRLSSSIDGSNITFNCHNGRC